MVIFCFLVFLLVNLVLSFFCDKLVQVCEIFFYIDYYLMMFNYNVCVVYFENGKLYRYNVINILVVDFIFMEDVIIGDGWEVR